MAAQQDPSLSNVAHNAIETISMVWVLLAATLVLLMQIGFMLLEAGSVRSKNSINVAQKNMLDFAFATIGFAFIGFMFAFAASGPFPIGWDSNFLLLSNLESDQIIFFLFQVMFCGTAATIVSGAVAERMRLSAYLICSLVLAVFIYPIFAHWAWGAALAPSSGAFLANQGFVDFAGSSVVHATGAWIALAACLILGPRLGRFDKQGNPRRISGQNPVLATAGAFFLFVGWIGFNGGSTMAANADVPQIVLNTVMAGAIGALIGYFLGMAHDGVVYPEKIMNGMLGGLVAVTAGCQLLETSGAMLIGALGSAGAILFNIFLERRCKIDDAVGAIGVHGCAGVIGTIMLAVLAPPENLPLQATLPQLLVQVKGAGINFAFTFASGILLFYTLHRTMKLRVSRRDEWHGLNEAEHGTSHSIGHMEAAMHALTRGKADLTARIEVEPGDEMETFTSSFNNLLDKFEEVEQVRKKSSDELRTLQEASRMNELANATFEGLCIIRGGELLDCNNSFEQLIGYNIDEIKGRPISDFVTHFHLKSLEQSLASNSTEAREIELIGRNRLMVPVELRSREIIYQGANANVLAIVDLRERKRTEKRIFHLAQHDTLTDLPNRALFNKHLSETLDQTRRGDTGFALHFIDLDRFKDINDMHGHPAGDAVIKETANRLRKLIAPEDMVARLGGDEFAIIQKTGGDQTVSEKLAAAIVHAFSEPFRLARGSILRSGSSVGLVNCKQSEDSTPEAVVQRADTALYHAKNNGRNCYAIFEEGMDAERKERQSIEQDLHDAIMHGELENHYQPRMDLSSGKIISYEALVRWNHPWRGLLGPNSFIPVAEQSRKIIEIGDWVMRRACLDAVAHMRGAQVSVNVSPIQLRDVNFSIRLEEILRETGLRPDLLELEITENLLIDDDDGALKMLNLLSNMGVKVALDDFGTGYSSLSYLSRFKFNTVKIDRSFIRHVDKDMHSIAIVDSIFSLAHALNMRVVAEGVEDEEQFLALVDRRCDEIQGYLIGRPVPIAEIIHEVPEFLREENYKREQIFLPV